MTALLIAGAGAKNAPAADAPADSVSTDSLSSASPDSLRPIVVQDSLGIPGTLKGQTTQSPEQVKEMLERMGSSEVEGRTAWERKKNPTVAILCSAILPGLGQTYNGRRLKVGLMVGFMSYYAGNGYLDWKRYEASIAARDAAEPGSPVFRQENANADIHKENARRFLWWTGAVWIVGILDSWIDAHLYDVREYTPPARPETSGLPSSSGPNSYVTVGFSLDWK